MIHQSSNPLETIFNDLENTASWLGVKVISVGQRNDYNDTPLHTVCSWGELKPVQVLVSAGADVNAKGDKGFTPLFNAIVGQNVDVIEYLLACGASTRLTNDWGDTAYDYAAGVKSSPRILSLIKPKA